jgi:hypothetical protein
MYSGHRQGYRRDTCSNGILNELLICNFVTYKNRTNIFIKLTKNRTNLHINTQSYYY